MGARVLYPVSLSELYKLKSPSTVVQRSLPSNRKINRIKKDLFGPTDRTETKKFFENEIEKHQESAAKKWGFDFRGGYPLVGQGQYIWERVGFTEFIPEMYTLSRAAHVREVPSCDEITPAEELLDERAARQNMNSVRFLEVSQNDSVIFKVPIEERLSSSICATSSSKRQPKITEYMKERKRLAPTPKKISPAKRMRSSSLPSAVQAKHLKGN